MHAGRRCENERRLKDITHMSGGLLLFSRMRRELKMKKRKTHFEEIPIAVVQKLLSQEIEDSEREGKIQEDPDRLLGKAKR
jgi:hypothetical protein